MEKKTHQNKPLHTFEIIWESLRWKSYCHIIILYTILYFIFSHEKCRFGNKAGKRCQKTLARLWPLAGWLRRGEKCVAIKAAEQVRLHLRSQAEEISRVNLSCGPGGLQADIGWSHYKEINGASTSWTLVPMHRLSASLNGEEQNHLIMWTSYVILHKVFIALQLQTKRAEMKSVVKWFPSRCVNGRPGDLKGSEQDSGNSQSLTTTPPSSKTTSVLCFQISKGLILTPQRAGWQLLGPLSGAKFSGKNETLSGFLFSWHNFWATKCPNESYCHALKWSDKRTRLWASHGDKDVLAGSFWGACVSACTCMLLHIFFMRQKLGSYSHSNVATPFHDHALPLYLFRCFWNLFYQSKSVPMSQIHLVG